MEGYIPLDQQKCRLALREHIVHVDSRDRNRSIYAGTNEWKVRLESTGTDSGANTGKKFDRVVSVELLHASLPNTNSVLDEPYLILDVEELRCNPVVSGTNITLKNAFTKLMLDTTTDAFAKVTHCFGQSKIAFETPITLNSLTIRIYDDTGTLFNFGSDTSPPTAVTETVQTSFTFKVTTIEQDVGSFAQPLFG